MTWRNLERPINHDRKSKVGDDVAQCGPSDSAIKLRSSLKARGGGGGGGWYVTHSDSSANHF